MPSENPSTVNDSMKTIYLEYESLEDSKQRLTFEVFYWASFIGRNDIVNCLIKLGYSHLVKPHKYLLNAVFGAVRGNQYETLKLILSYNYISKNYEEFEKGKEARNYNGNTVMHFAYYHQREKIAKLLEDNGFNDQVKVQRNNRGLLPVDMNHRADVIEAFEERAQLKRLTN